MKWIKKGLIYAPNNELWWQQKYCMLPTPLLLSDRIRVFFSSACKDNIGRITFIDLDIDNPRNIIYNPNSFISDKGDVGTFDENGMIPSCIININNRWHLYYAGYQRHFSSPYSILSGLLTSDDGLRFKKYSSCPILERTNKEVSIRSAPTIIWHNNIFKMWYISSEEWMEVKGYIHNGKLLPKYSIKYGESVDAINWEVNDDFVLDLKDDEFGLARPFIFIKEDYLHLFYSVRSANKSYRMGYAKSKDGVKWERKDNEVGIDVSDSGWDSEMICYPAIIEVKDKTYLFYNGNNNGATGFGFAELENNSLL